MARDHYVQQRFMKGFTNKKGHLCMFDKERWKHSDHVVPQHVLYEREYETTTLAAIFKEIEKTGMEAIEFIRGGGYGAVTNDMLQGLLIYLVTHLNRSPHHFEALRARTSGDREVAYLTETPYIILNSGNISFMPAEFRPSAVPLYLTDNLVCIIGVGERKGLVTFPVTSRLMIVGYFPSPHAEGNQLTWQNKPWTPPDEMAMKINTVLFKRAARFVLCEDAITPPISGM